MIPIISLLVILGTSLIVIRSAAVALEHTGLSRHATRFQARSAFTGVGFTTKEAEHVVADPVRRRIIMWLMLVGNAGVMSAMAALLLSAIDLRTGQGVGFLLVVFFGGLAFLWALGSNRWVDRQMCHAIRWAIKRWSSLDTSDYLQLLHLRDEYGVSRVRVGEDAWIAGKSLRAARLSEEGLLVLGIECPGGNFVGTPPADVEVRDGDELVLYGRASRISELTSRGLTEDGERAHGEAVEEHRAQTRSERRQARR